MTVVMCSKSMVGALLEVMIRTIIVAIIVHEYEQNIMQRKL